MKHIRITASEGMILTNGETYGKEVFLGSDDSPENWYEITEAEYRKLVQEEVYEENLY